MATAKHITQSVTYKPIKGYPGYRVGDDGSVWTCKLRGPKCGRTSEWVKLKPTARGGYLYVGLWDGRKRKNMAIHSLVLAEFVGPKPEGMMACHYDGDRTNNRPSNLRWDTSFANMDDMKRHGRNPAGSRNPHSKLTEKKVANILRLVNRGMIQAEVARRYKVNKTVVNGIILGRSWKHVPRPSGELEVV